MDLGDRTPAPPDLQGVLPVVREAIARGRTIRRRRRRPPISLGALLYRVGQTGEAVETLTKAGRGWEHDGPPPTPPIHCPRTAGTSWRWPITTWAIIRRPAPWLTKPKPIAGELGETGQVLAGFPGVSCTGASALHLEYLQREARSVVSTSAPKAKVSPE